jgi:hypothetical protein
MYEQTWFDLPSLTARFTKVISLSTRLERIERHALHIIWQQSLSAFFVFPRTEPHLKAGHLVDDCVDRAL